MPQRPNILIVTTDQQRTDSLSCYGSSFTHTPHLDRMAAEGVLFERAYCANPVCMPSRVSIFTGKQVSRHGVWNVGVNTPEGETFVSHLLKAAGYRTHYIGKAHFQAFGCPFDASLESLLDWERRYPAFRGPYYGFDSVELAPGHGPYGATGHYGAWVRSQVSAREFDSYKASRPLTDYDFGGNARDSDTPLRLHNSVWTADRGIEFLRKQDGSKPFLLAVGFQDPHHPHVLPVEFKDRVDPAAVPAPDFMEGELEDKPFYFQETHYGLIERSSVRGAYPVAGTAAIDFSRVSDKDARLGRAYYYGMVRLIDQQMGRILRCLDETGLARNTLVIFTTDHGELLGDHGLWLKGPYHYEQLVRVPLLARWPDGIPGGGRTAALCSHVDLVPTMLSAADVPVPAACDGADALPLMRGERAAIRDHVLVECVDDPARLRLKTVVTPGRKLTWCCGHSFGELYDLERDPREKVNRWNDPTYAADKTALLARILADMERNEPRPHRHCYA